MLGRSEQSHKALRVHSAGYAVVPSALMLGDNVTRAFECMKSEGLTKHLLTEEKLTSGHSLCGGDIAGRQEWGLCSEAPGNRRQSTVTGAAVPGPQLERSARKDSDLSPVGLIVGTILKSRLQDHPTSAKGPWGASGVSTPSLDSVPRMGWRKTAENSPRALFLRCPVPCTEEFFEEQMFPMKGPD
ncbi:unnamed protein product [Rangifer tarandus platyrhynchus]|nr:unnamed protein product [Rangifer tarandus platyrhynchus]CAI9710294.1 unnamed protein product [Rangifer tarandus platyrhynchus]